MGLALSTTRINFRHDLGEQEGNFKLPEFRLALKEANNDILDLPIYHPCGNAIRNSGRTGTEISRYPPLRPAMAKAADEPKTPYLVCRLRGVAPRQKVIPGYGKGIEGPESDYGYREESFSHFLFHRAKDVSE